METCFQTAGEPLIDQNVIEAPADVPFPNTLDRAPPSVVSGLAAENTESVTKSVAKNVIQPLPLLGKEACVLPVCGKIGHIPLFMGDVQIPRDNEGLSAPSPLPHVGA